MKKILLVIISIIVLSLIAVYVLIPSSISISKATLFNCTENGSERILSDQKLWSKWWPVKNDSTYTSNGYGFRVNRRIADDIEIIIQKDNDSISSIVNILPISNDSASFTWKCKLEAGLSPFDRIGKYFKAADIKKSMDEITESFKNFISKKENVYNVKIDQLKVVDTLLITYKTGINKYPTTQTIYELINRLKDYAAAQGAKQTNPPMLHVEQMDSSLYGVMVAIPLDKEIPGKGDFLFKRMPRGNILVSSEIKGGIKEVNKVYESMANFVTDYQRISPGLSFQSLITDRVSEPDSSKWITKIYYPVF